MQRLISTRTRTGAPLNMGLNCSDLTFPALLPLPCTQILIQQNCTVPCTSPCLSWFWAGIKFSQVLGYPCTQWHLTTQKSDTPQIFRSRCLVACHLPLPSYSFPWIWGLVASLHGRKVSTSWALFILVGRDVGKE